MHVAVVNAQRRTSAPDCEEQDVMKRCLILLCRPRSGACDPRVRARLADQADEGDRAVAPGSVIDIVPALVFEQLSAQLGQSIVVENRPGAGQTIGPCCRQGGPRWLYPPRQLVRARR